MATNPNSASASQYYKRLTPAFFQNDWEEGFAIYYRIHPETDGDGERFEWFADYTPQDREKILSILKDGTRQQLYIPEADLLRYYKRSLVKKLSFRLAERNPSSQEILRSVYPVATEIMREYFETRVSANILTALDDLPKFLETGLSRENLRFQSIYNITGKDHTIHTHCVNVGFYCLSLGVHMNMKARDLRELCLGGMLADIGKKTVPENILNKMGSLTPAELKEVRRHTSVGSKILKSLFNYSNNILLMAAEHHENFDGTGYPFKYARERISLFARICRIMDVFNAMTCQRSYKKALSPAVTIAQIKNEMPGCFDPKLLAQFILSLTPK